MMIKTFEAYAKYKREKFKSEPLKVDDEFLFQYSNGKGMVKVKSINNGTVELMRAGGYGGSKWQTSDIITFPLSMAQKMKDDEHIEKHVFVQNFNEEVHNISKKLKLNKIVGGDLSNQKTLNEFAKALDTLKFLGDEYNTEDSSVGAAGGWSGTMRASRSGTAISFSFNDIHHGDYYGFDRAFIVQIKVGGGLNYEKQKVLLEISNQLLSKVSYTTKLGTSRIETTDGTNWSSVMLVAPQNSKEYSPINNLPSTYASFERKRKALEDSAKKYNL